MMAGRLKPKMTLDNLAAMVARGFDDAQKTAAERFKLIVDRFDRFERLEADMADVKRAIGRWFRCWSRVERKVGIKS